MDKIIIFDTTLRDGEQCPGASLGVKEKLEIARILERLGVDIIEAGFPIASPGDFEATKCISAAVRGSIICGLARATKQDIDAAYQALKKARRARVHVFLATSKIHMRYKLRKLEDEVIKQAAEAVRYARRFCDDIEFSPEDASRSEEGFLFKVVESVIDAGATTINIPDTVGYAIPEQFGRLVHNIKSNVPNIDRAVISVHCHNDLGLAVSNSLSAIRHGARQVECTMNGIGERAGNAALEEIVMAIKTRRDFFENAEVNINTRYIYKASKVVSSLTGIAVQPNKAIVGDNAFRHEAGIHQDGILKKRTTYEIIRPEEIGLAGTKLVLGKHSGRHAFSERLKILGFSLSQKDMDKAFIRFKELADRKKEVFDDDLIAIIEDITIAAVPEVYSLKYFHTTSGTDSVPTATVRLKVKDKIIQDAACGDGPVDACYKAIDRISRLRVQLMDYSIRAVTSGKDALGEVALMLKGKNSRVVTGRATSTDIIEASARAYVNAINKLVYLPCKTIPKPKYSL